MRKLGGITLALALAFVGSTAAAAAPTQQWVTKAGAPFDASTVRFNESEVQAFKERASSVPQYGMLSAASLASIGRDLCEHYSGGFTTEDLLASNGESLAALGEAAKETVCA
ncbi:hypothetical protein [Arthrobacter sp. 31Y]|uniref:hypothetical protein n=1 Tax=Arthrobacter sp. 31Y TaxID=1115632 RepID=UPI0004ACB00E|nr:hypothetical protein [Arthrobacter sp. 31Y]